MCGTCGKDEGIGVLLSKDGRRATVVFRGHSLLEPGGTSGGTVRTLDGLSYLDLERPNGGVEFSSCPYLLWPYLEAKRMQREMKESEARRPEIEARIARMEKAIERLKTRLGNHAIVNVQKLGEE